MNAESFVPRAKPGSYKHWWDNALSDLKEKSIDAHKLWKICAYRNFITRLASF